MELLQKEYAEFLLGVFEKYLEIYLLRPLEPEEELLKYDLAFLHNRKWDLFGKILIESDLIEITNAMNEWRDLLNRWCAWNIVLKNHEYNDMQVWDIEAEFLVLIISKCLFMPSKMRDIFTSKGIEDFHQVRLSLDKGYKDYIPYDSEPPNFKKKVFHRNKSEEIFTNIISYWESDNLISCLKSLNSKSYIERTKNFRNLSSHSIAPRISRGVVSLVTRRIVPKTQLIRSGEAGNIISYPDEKSVSYSFGGVEALDRDELFQANLEEFKKARTCYIAYRTLLEEAVSKIPLVEED